MKFSLLKLLTTMTAVLLFMASCSNPVIPGQAGRATEEPSASAALPAEPDPSTFDQDSAIPLPSGGDAWQIYHLAPRIYGQGWMLVANQLWYVNSEGIHYLDLKTGDETTVSTADKYNTIFAVDHSLWFACNYLWGDYFGFPKDQLSLAQYNLEAGQYHEYPVDYFCGANASVAEALGQVFVLEGGKLFQYDKAADQFNKATEYGEDIWRIAGNENLLVTYKDPHTGDFLRLYDESGGMVEYDPLEYLPGTYVTEMDIVKDTLFICWGGEGSPMGVSCLNTQTKAWLHYIDPMLEKDFTTPLEHIEITGSGGEIWIKGEDTVYLPLINASPKCLLKYSYAQQEFQLLYETEELICDATPFKNGHVIALLNKVVFLDSAGNINTILENSEVMRVIKKDEDTVLAITEEGIFECRYAE